MSRLQRRRSRSRKKPAWCYRTINSNRRLDRPRVVIKSSLSRKDRRMNGGSRGATSASNSGVAPCSFTEHSDSLCALLNWRFNFHSHRGRVIKLLSLIIFTVRKYATRHHRCYRREQPIILPISRTFILPMVTRFLNTAKRNGIDFSSHLGRSWKWHLRELDNIFHWKYLNCPENN